MFSWFQAFVAPFVIAYGGVFWHDTIVMVIPPTDIPIDISYVPDPKTKCLVIGLTFGAPREYDPDTGGVGPEILTPEAGVYHRQEGYMQWHWDPLVESVLKTNPYPQLLWCSSDRPYDLRVVNKTGKYILVDITFWVIKFPKKVPCQIWGECDPEELFRRYMEGVTAFFTALSKVGAAKVVELLSGKLRFELGYRRE